MSSANTARWSDRGSVDERCDGAATADRERHLLSALCLGVAQLLRHRELRRCDFAHVAVLQRSAKHQGAPADLRASAGDGARDASATWS